MFDSSIDQERDRKKEDSSSDDEIPIINIGQSSARGNARSFVSGQPSNRVYYSNTYDDGRDRRFRSGYSYRGNGNRASNESWNEPRNEQIQHRASSMRGNYHQSGNRGNARTNRFSAVPHNLRGTAVTCNYCKKIGHIARNCRAKNACYNCGGVGHFIAVCPSQRRTGQFRRSQSADQAARPSRQFERNAWSHDIHGEQNVGSHDLLNTERPDEQPRNRHSSDIGRQAPLNE